jgi:uncharacterized membrane protein YphA (DoxX/SURF4 family)
MKLSQPLGNKNIGPLLIRITLGSYFLIAGIAKTDKLVIFADYVKNLGILPEPLAQAYGFLLPFVEIMVGIMLFFGIWTVLASLISSLMLLSFIFALGVYPNNSMFFNKDILLLATAVGLMNSGAGYFSFDRIKS